MSSGLLVRLAVAIALCVYLARGEDTALPGPSDQADDGGLVDEGDIGEGVEEEDGEGVQLARPEPVNVLYDNWRNCTMDTLKRNAEQFDLEDIYQFGVFSGGSLNALRYLTHDARIPVRKAWGFDWLGAPKYNLAAHLKTDDPEELADVVENVINGGNCCVKKCAARRRRTSTPAKLDYEIVYGDVRHTLSPGFKQDRGMEPAMYVDLDIGLNPATTLKVVRWLLDNDLLRHGTVVGTTVVGKKSPAYGAMRWAEKSPEAKGKFVRIKGCKGRAFEFVLNEVRADDGSEDGRASASDAVPDGAQEEL